MKTLAVTVLSLATAMASVIPTQAAQAAQPEPQLTVYRSPAGGRILFGFDRGASSAETLLRSGMSAARGFFDAAPVLISGARSKDGHLIVASFTGATQGTRVGGLVLATYDEDHASRVALVSDSLERLPKTIGALTDRLNVISQSELAKLQGGARTPGLDMAAYAEAAKHVALASQTYPDGTATIGVAAGYEVRVMESGKFSAIGPDGAYVNIANPIGVLDPSGSEFAQMRALTRQSGGAMSLPPGTFVVPYTTDLAAGWVAARRQMARQRGFPDPSIEISQSKALPSDPSWPAVAVQGTQTLGGKRMAFAATLTGSPPSPSGAWQISITILNAPVESLGNDMPALVAMQRSQHVNLQALTAATNASIGASQRGLAQQLATQHAQYMQLSAERFQAVMAREQATQTAIDQSAAGFKEMISGTTWVHDAATGNDEHLTQNSAYSLVKNDPANFTELSIAQYQAGKHYH